MENINEQRVADTFFENPPTRDPQANGMIEKGVHDVKPIVRTVKMGLESRLGIHLGDDHAAVDWIIQHACWLLNNFSVGRDGRAPAQRLTGRRHHRALVEFGEFVLAKPRRNLERGVHRPASLAPRWVKGVWLGINHRSGEHLIAVDPAGRAQQCVIRVRTVRRLPEADR